MKTERNRLLESVNEMQQASDLIDESYGGSDYNARLVALALIAREFLRRDPLSALGAPPHADAQPRDLVQRVHPDDRPKAATGSFVSGKFADAPRSTPAPPYAELARDLAYYKPIAERLMTTAPDAVHRLRAELNDLRRAITSEIVGLPALLGHDDGSQAYALETFATRLSKLVAAVPFRSEGDVPAQPPINGLDSVHLSQSEFREPLEQAEQATRNRDAILRSAAVPPGAADTRTLQSLLRQAEHVEVKVPENDAERLRSQIGRVKAALLREDSQRAETLFGAASGLCIAASAVFKYLPFTEAVAPAAPRDAEEINGLDSVHLSMPTPTVLHPSDELRALAAELREVGRRIHDEWGGNGMATEVYSLADRLALLAGKEPE